MLGNENSETFSVRRVCLVFAGRPQINVGSRTLQHVLMRINEIGLRLMPTDTAHHEYLSLPKSPLEMLMRRHKAQRKSFGWGVILINYYRYMVRSHWTVAAPPTTCWISTLTNAQPTNAKWNHNKFKRLFLFSLGFFWLRLRTEQGMCKSHNSMSKRIWNGSRTDFSECDSIEGKKYESTNAIHSHAWCPLSTQWSNWFMESVHGCLKFNSKQKQNNTNKLS